MSVTHEPSERTPRGRAAAALPDVPTHLRCALAAAAPDSQGSCIDNPRVRSDCASDVAGGLVEVYWQ